MAGSGRTGTAPPLGGAIRNLPDDCLGCAWPMSWARPDPGMCTTVRTVARAKQRLARQPSGPDPIPPRVLLEDRAVDADGRARYFSGRLARRAGSLPCATAGER